MADTKYPLTPSAAKINALLCTAEFANLTGITTPDDTDLLLARDVTNSEYKKIAFSAIRTLVIATALTGLSLADSSDITATDTILSALGKLQAHLSETDEHLDDTDNPHEVTAAQAEATPILMPITTISASTTLALAHADNMLRCTNSTAIDLTIPLNASVAFGIGTQITIYAAGAGDVSVVATSGVTINSLGAALSLADQYTTAVLIKTDTDTWELVGAIA